MRLDVIHVRFRLDFGLLRLGFLRFLGVCGLGFLGFRGFRV